MRWLLSLLALLACAGMVGLGLWQLDRARYKEQRLEAFDQALSAPAGPITRAMGDAGQLPERVAGVLTFPPDLPWLLLDNQRRGNRIGVLAYRLAEPQPGLPMPMLLVEFGWLPMSPQRDIPELPEPPDRVELTGTLLPPPPTGLRMGRSPALTRGHQPVRLMLHLDPGEISDALGRDVHPRILRIDPDQPIGFERDLQLLPNTLPPAKHRGYAMQWFGLAATLLAIALLLLFRSRHR